MEAADDPAWVAPEAGSRAIVELTALQESAASRSFVARKLSVILGESDDYDRVVQGLLERRDRPIVTGAEGLGKSTLVRQLAVTMAAGVAPVHVGADRPGPGVGGGCGEHRTAVASRCPVHGGALLKRGGP